MSSLTLRDRDSIITEEGLIFRVLGYSHPPNGYFCDAEYAPETVFKSDNPKALRSNEGSVFYKFYDDESWRLIRTRFPKYLISHEMLGKKVLGVLKNDVVSTVKPQKKLHDLLTTKPTDPLTTALAKVLETITSSSSLSIRNFGVFGSMLHGFHHPMFSDIDLIIYRKSNVDKLRVALKELYADSLSRFKNEFDTDETIEGKHWKFQNLTAKEFAWHQRRKLIYGLFLSENSRRKIKMEFEPVKDWKEIRNEYDSKTRIVQKGWVRMYAHVTEDSDAPFMPSIYEIKPMEVLQGAEGANDVERIVSYMEEFRMQASKDEKVYVEGNLEEVITPEDCFFQIALTYCPRYYEQALKVVSPQA